MKNVGMPERTAWRFMVMMTFAVCTMRVLRTVLLSALSILKRMTALLMTRVKKSTSPARCIKFRLVIFQESSPIISSAKKGWHKWRLVSYVKRERNYFSRFVGPVMSACSKHGRIVTGLKNKNVKTKQKPERKD